VEFSILMIIIQHPFEEEVGSVGEQPISNKMDTNMVMAV
jgi:hypothetical protein